LQTPLHFPNALRSPEVPKKRKLFLVGFAGCQGWNFRYIFAMPERMGLGGEHPFSEGFCLNHFI
jgi:hypothetical protein